MKHSLPNESEQQVHRSSTVAEGSVNLIGKQQENFIDNRATSIVQRQLIADINASPKMVAQHMVVELLHNNPRMAAQRQQYVAIKNPALQLQRKFASEPSVQLAQQSVVKPNNTGLPDNLKAGIESLSGISMDNVNVHYNSSRPVQLNALAYAQGADIHLAPGQERHLPHEAWHVVQQAQGRVRPTVQMKGDVAVNNDAELEREADEMGNEALSAGRSVSQQVESDSSHPMQSYTTKTVRPKTFAPIQRLIGFEIEYQVPTFAQSSAAVKLQNGENEPNPDIKHFLFGGLPYESKLGGSAKPGDNSYRITSDHKGALSTEPIRAKLAAMGKLDPADTKDPDASSNLEYVTSPVDELSKGSDKVLDKLINDVTSHANTTFGLATKADVGLLTSPASKAATGTPENHIKDWLSDEDFQKIKPRINNFRSNIVDSCYLQTTVGILPSSIGALMEKAKGDESLLVNTGNFASIYKAIDDAASSVGGKVGSHTYIKNLKTKNEVQLISSVSGMVRLLAMYLVGEALSQTSAFPGGTIKNAVPFLVKIDPSKIAYAGPYSMLFDEVPDDFVISLAGFLAAQPEFTVDYWRKLGFASRTRASDDWVTAGSFENLTKLFLQGKKPGATGAQTGGSSIDKLDKVDAVSGSNEYQSGIPLEYRYIKARPTATGLKAELLKLVAEARELNLRSVSEDKKEEIEKQVKE